MSEIYLDEFTNFLFSACAKIDVAIRPFAKDQQEYSLLEFPDHSNAGDSAIWLGSLKCLERHFGRPPSYVCTSENFDPAALAASSNGPIFLKGGGSLGDVWYDSQLFREKVIRLYPDRTIVQLPQSIHFEDPVKAERAAACFASHRDFHLLVRDKHSCLIALETLKIESVLCPDMAFYLGPQKKPLNAIISLLALLRTDKESKSSALRNISRGNEIHDTDWLFEEDLFIERVRSDCSNQDRHSLYKNLADLRLRRGLLKLSLGAKVLTDRLHGHILCVLLGIPHLVFDNSYGKIGNFYHTWSNGLRSVCFAADISGVSSWLNNEDLSEVELHDLGCPTKMRMTNVYSDHSSEVSLGMLVMQMNFLEQKLSSVESEHRHFELSNVRDQQRAWAELGDARAVIEERDQALQNAWAELGDARAVIEERDQALQNAWAELGDARAVIEERDQALQNAWAELGDARAVIEERDQALQNAWAELGNARQEVRRSSS